MKCKVLSYLIFMYTLNNRQIGIVIGSGILLFVPLVAMQLTNEVYWTLIDFVVAAVLLLTTGLLCEWILRAVNNKYLRIALVALGILLLLLIWVELAVGIFGSPFAGD